MVAAGRRENGDVFMELTCLTPAGYQYEIPSVSEAWIEEKMDSGVLESGETLLVVPVSYTHLTLPTNREV